MTALPIGWTTAKLGDVVVDGKLTNGLSPATGGAVEHRVLTLSAVTSGKYRPEESKEALFAKDPTLEQLVRDGSFLLSRGNGNPDLVGVGVVASAGNEPTIYPDTVIGGVIDDSKVIPNYLAAIWKSPEVRQQLRKAARTTNGTFKVNQKSLGAVTFPLPPREEQQRIARILDHVDGLRARRRASIASLDDLLVSIYHQMFVADAAAPYWDEATVEDLLVDVNNAIRTGPFGSQLLKEEFTDEGIPVLGIDNVTTNEFLWGERRYISEEKYQQLKRYTVRPGDVLITIMGTNGRVAIVPDDIPVAINTKHLCCITLDQERCTPEYLRATFLWHPKARHYLKSKTKGAIMGGLNMGIIKMMPLSVPPPAIQQEFTARARQVDVVRQQYRAHLEQLNDLFASLQSRAFRGDL
ncbi:restriction endonuclease subunit S [Streptomyces violarus]|uniref:restriction endonuclease subunit S n=1 Tax=Streptomyces violarus TaxID=67380 RepID=UPI0021BF8569|nr:restriction endonuclease subunit S [Streptomyces violarus]MCT9140260.1 restriction endonuclease subunit S [Streptomyces violarus]